MCETCDNWPAELGQFGYWSNCQDEIPNFSFWADGPDETLGHEFWMIYGYLAIERIDEILHMRYGILAIGQTVQMRYGMFLASSCTSFLQHSNISLQRRK